MPSQSKKTALVGWHGQMGAKSALLKAHYFCHVYTLQDHGIN